MVYFLFRSPRIEHELIMSVGLQDMHTDTPLSDTLTATVINFSPQGACLVLPKLMLNGKHLFYETLNSDRYILLLDTRRSVSDDNALTIGARSIWMNSCEHMQKPAFKIGIQFLHDQMVLYKLLKKGH